MHDAVSAFADHAEQPERSALAGIRRDRVVQLRPERTEFGVDVEPVVVAVAEMERRLAHGTCWWISRLGGA